jgi:hypothetical protein
MGTHADRKKKRKEQAKEAEETETAQMVAVLATKWRCQTVSYKCVHCLRLAHQAVVTGTNGYVTDDELIAASSGMLRHK